MSITPDKRLYDYTRALAAGIALTEGNLKSFLPKLYLENTEFLNGETPLVYEGDIPDRFAQAYEDALDRIGFAFNVPRGPNETDDAYRQKIKLRIIQNPTLSGISNSIKTVFSGLGLDVNVVSVNARENFFDAVGTNFSSPFRGLTGARSYRIIIEVSSAFKYSFPKYVDTVSSGVFYRVKKPGYYTLTLDPNGDTAGEGVIDVVTRNVQRAQFLIPVFSSEVAFSGIEIDLGFLTQFQEIRVTRNSDNSDIFYNSKLTFNKREFDFYKNPAYNGLLTAFGVGFLREIFNNTLSFGVIIERIIVRQAGSGG
jgi:hypothetical protein